jgi:3-oxocholest-4-en-26-oate---CoA ligase
MSQWNYARTWEAIARVVPERTAIVTDDGRRLTFRAFDERATRLAHVFAGEGIKRGDVVGIALTNGPEYLETFFAALKLGAAPANVNYQYGAEELAYMLRDSGASAVVYGGGLALAIEAAVDALDEPPRLLLSVGDEHDAATERDFEVALARAPDGPVARDREPSGDDVMLLYTGGTTGMPKGVVWRTEDYALMGWEMGRPGTTPPAPEEAMRAGKRAAALLPASPLIHGTALGLATTTLNGGGTIVLRTDPHVDAAAIWALVEREQVAVLGIVGDTFARPLLDELASPRFERDVSSLRAIVSSGMTFSPTNKAHFLELLPGLTIVDSLGSSEGMMTRSTSRGAPAAVAATFSGDGLRVVTDDGRDVAPGSGEDGLVMVAGRLPLGYHNDPEATARAFREIDGVRYSIPGDRARVLDDGQIELLGRGSSCINTGGEKVYPEEVEGVLRRHSLVSDAGVVGVPDDRWGEMVVAVVEPAGHDNGIEAELTEHCREHLAGYKRPKRYVMVERLPRTVAGKPEYVRLREHAAAAIARRSR